MVFADGFEGGHERTIPARPDNRLVKRQVVPEKRGKIVDVGLHPGDQLLEFRKFRGGYPLASQLGRNSFDGPAGAEDVSRLTLAISRGR